MVQQKLRTLEERSRYDENLHAQEKNRMQTEIKSLRERLEAVKGMNFNLQKINSKYKKKAEQFDYI